MGELLSGASYALSGCLFLSEITLSHGVQTGLDRLYSASLALWRFLHITSVLYVAKFTLDNIDAVLGFPC